jgi:hypothetical protein
MPQGRRSRANQGLSDFALDCDDAVVVAAYGRRLHAASCSRGRALSNVVKRFLKIISDSAGKSFSKKPGYKEWATRANDAAVTDLRDTQPTPVSAP